MSSSRCSRAGGGGARLLERVGKAELQADLRLEDPSAARRSDLEAALAVIRLPARIVVGTRNVTERCEYRQGDGERQDLTGLFHGVESYADRPMLHHKLIAIPGVLLLAACGGAPPESDVRSAEILADGIVAELTEQADRWDQAIVAKDRVAIEANMAEDFRQIDRSGNVETRASFVDGLMALELEIDPYTVEDFDVRLYGTVALLSGRTRLTGRYRGESFVSHYRYIDIYVWRNGEWNIVSVQISPIPEAATT